jgi:hypothetical protein
MKKAITSSPALLLVCCILVMLTVLARERLTKQQDVKVDEKTGFTVTWVETQLDKQGRGTFLNHVATRLIRSDGQFVELQKYFTGKEAVGWSQGERFLTWFEGDTVIHDIGRRLQPQDALAAFERVNRADLDAPPFSALHGIKVVNVKPDAEGAVRSYSPEMGGLTLRKLSHAGGLTWGRETVAIMRGEPDQKLWDAFMKKVPAGLSVVID